MKMTDESQIAMHAELEEEYRQKVQIAIENGTTNVCRALRSFCPECELYIFPEENEESAFPHGMLGPWVIIGCEGYYVIDPNLVGIDMPNWMPIDADVIADSAF